MNPKQNLTRLSDVLQIAGGATASAFAFSNEAGMVASKGLKKKDLTPATLD